MDDKIGNRIQDFLIQEGLSSLRRTVFLIERLWETCPVPEEGFAIISNGEVPACLIDLCTSFGSASTMLFDDSAKKSTENRRVYELRLARANFVMHACDGLDLSILRDRSMRHRIVHMDEYLTKQLLADPDANLLINMGLSHREAIVGNLQYCRVYIANEKKMLHVGCELDLAGLHEVGNAVLNRLLPADLPA